MGEYNYRSVIAYLVVTHTRLVNIAGSCVPIDLIYNTSVTIIFDCSRFTISRTNMFRKLPTEFPSISYAG